MRIVCGWCRELIGSKPPDDDPRTSHGICPRCEAGMDADSSRASEPLTSEARASTIVPRPPEPDKTPGDQRP
mgnify:CR=1 FL=1